LLDALGVGQGGAPKLSQGAAHVVLAHSDLAGHRGRVQPLATVGLVALVELLNPLQRPPRRRLLVGLGSATVGISGLQGGQLLR